MFGESMILLPWAFKFQIKFNLINVHLSEKCLIENDELRLVVGCEMKNTKIGNHVCYSNIFRSTNFEQRARVCMHG